MKFQVSSSVLSNHLQAISRVINSKNSLPILDCFIFEIQEGRLSVTVSDSETTMTTTFAVLESDVNGKFAISARTLLEALRESADQTLSFDVNTKTYEIMVNYLNGHYSMVGQNAEEFPLSPQLSQEVTHIEIDTQVLLTGISRALFATADDELRPVMNGVYFDITTEDITMVASDGHKLVRNRTLAAKGSNKASFILPKKPAGLLKSILAKEEGICLIDFDDKNLIVSVGDFRMVCRLIEGRYPNYNTVIPQNNPFKITVDRQSFISALRRVSIFSSQSSSLVKLHFENDQIQISAKDIDFSTSAQESLACHFEGNSMSIGFKSPFLVDILNNISSDEVIMELADPSRAGVIVPLVQEENEDLLMLLMPMMLND